MKQSEPSALSCHDEPTVSARPLIYAHRGSSVLAPENTAVAFALALGFGADVLETDVRLSRDGRVMVHHDERLERTSDGRGRVCDANARDIERLDAGARFTHADGSPWRGDAARIESLDTLLMRYPHTHINIDIKDPIVEAAEHVAATIASHSAEARVTIGSFHSNVLSHFREIAPGIDTAASRTEVAALYFTPGAAFSTTRLPYRYLQIPVRYLGLPLTTARFLNTARRRGVEAVFWTVNDERTMRRLCRQGVSGIVTDRPDMLARLLGISDGASGTV